MGRLRQGASALALTLLLAAPARAEGPGLKLSDSLVLHLGLAAGVGYDSNVFFASGNTTTSTSNNCNPVTTPGCDATIGSAYVTLRPTIDLATLSVQRGGNTPHTLDFRLHLGSDIRLFATSDPDLFKHYSVGVDAGAAATVFPQGSTTFDIFDTYSRISTPPYAVTGISSTNINYDLNQFGMRLRVRPGGQRLEIALQYTLGFYLFETSLFQSKDYISNDVQLRVSWKFFPKTALYLNAEETAYTYVNNDPNTPPSAYPLRIVLGVIGLITAKLTVHANVGYGNGFIQAGGSHYATSPSYNNAIGLAELRWTPTLLTTTTLGYKHDFAQALVGTYYDFDTVYFAIQQQIWRLVLGGRLAWERRGYHGDLGPDFQTNNEANQRIDNLITMHLQVDLPIRDWIYVSVGDDLAKNFSNCALLATGGVTPIAEPCTYLRNDVWLRLGVTY